MLGWERLRDASSVDLNFYFEGAGCCYADIAIRPSAAPVFSINRSRDRTKVNDSVIAWVAVDVVDR